MYYQEFLPPKELTPFVKCFWILESPPDVSNVLYKDRVFPDGCMELIIHFGDPYLQYFENSSKLQLRSFIYGQIKQFIEIGPSSAFSGVIAARFFPHGVFPFLKIPIYEFQNQIIPLIEIFGKSALELEEIIQGSNNNQQRILHLSNFLSKTLYKADFQIDRRITKSLEELYKSRGTINIECLANRIELSSKQLERQFQSKIGLNPKYFARILRFQNIFQLMKSGQVKNLTQLAYAAGFSDQAHLSREFRHFTGTNPKSYFAKTDQLSELFIK